jgi:hypothetical protein
LRELILEQVKINDSITKSLATHDKVLKSINVKIDNLSAAIKVQLSYNKKIELQIAQLAAALPFATNPEQVNSVTTRRGKSTRDLAYPKGTERTPAVLVATKEKKDGVEEVVPRESYEMTQDFSNTNFLPFERRSQRVQLDEQFGKFIEVIQKLYIYLC